MARSTDKHRRALAHLRKKECDKAHEIVMGMRDKLAFRIHGLVHRIEGDLENARYWYDRADVPFGDSKPIAAELKEIESALTWAVSIRSAGAAIRRGKDRSRLKRSGSRRFRA
jgi:hypothetical protein